MSVRLDKQYSWDELSEIVANRIEESKMIQTKWNRKEFIKWFKDREHIGMNFDWKLVARCYTIWKQLRNAHDHFTVIVGGEGTGKSTLSMQYCAMITPFFKLDDCSFDMPGYIGNLQKLGKEYKKNKDAGNDRSLQIDEGGINLFSRESLSTSNKVLAKTFMVQRFLNANVVICIPHYWSLDTLIRNHRINTLIVITRRGDYKVFVGKGIKILNKLGKKDKDAPLWTIPIPYGYFWDGSFSKTFPKTIDESEYQKLKYKHIIGFLDDAKREANTVKMVKVKKLEKEFGIKSDTLIRQIQDGVIEGRQIGKQWFITKKAYDKLIMAK